MFKLVYKPFKLEIFQSILTGNWCRKSPINSICENSNFFLLLATEIDLFEHAYFGHNYGYDIFSSIVQRWFALYPLDLPSRWSPPLFLYNSNQTFFLFRVYPDYWNLLGAIFQNTSNLLKNWFIFVLKLDQKFCVA